MPNKHLVVYVSESFVGRAGEDECYMHVVDPGTGAERHLVFYLPRALHFYGPPGGADPFLVERGLIVADFELPTLRHAVAYAAGTDPTRSWLEGFGASDYGPPCHLNPRQTKLFEVDVEVP